MGTRNLTMVIADGETKVAQYGQWDGYPEGQGMTALNFLRGADLEAFKAKLADVRFLTFEEYDAAVEHITGGSDWIDMKQAADIDAIFPYITRNHGAAILKRIQDAPEGTDIAVFDQSSFAKDGLFCEYAYVIDLDARTFEAYVGFQREDHTDGRFGSLASAETFTPEYAGQSYYAPVRLMASWSLDALPDDETFLRTLHGVEQFYREQADPTYVRDENDAEAIPGPVAVVPAV